MTRRIAGILGAAALVSVAASPALALFGRGRPGIALACVLALGFAVTLAIAFRRLRFPEEVRALLLLPFAAAWGLGEGLGLFAHVRGWDALCHLVAGLAVGVIAAGLSADSVRATSLFARALAFALLVGLLWELGEWSSDRLLGTRTLGTPIDTRTDLLADMLGGALGGLALVAARRYLPAGERTRLLGGFDRLRRKATAA